MDKKKQTNLEEKSLRAQYHLTPPEHWLSDPQRPFYMNGKYTLYYLYSNPNNSPGGWRRATTGDNVFFQDGDIAIPLTEDIPVWTGSTIIDNENTAGFGMGTIIAIMTQPTNGDAYQQEQYLWYSQNEGKSFVRYDQVVIHNPDNSNWFRDPKLVWDNVTQEWIAAIGREQSIVFYTSKNLKEWQYKYTFVYTNPNIGGMECPDLYQIEADDGTLHWVLGASVQGDYSGKVNTFAYWTGTWNGEKFIVDEADPQWLDYGWDWYAAISWPDAEKGLTLRYSLAWMNNWEYANRSVPTDLTDGYNGQMSIVRQITLKHKSDKYRLISKPISNLDKYITKSIELPDISVNENSGILYKGDSYRIKMDLTWDKVENFGVQIGESVNGERHTDIGIFGNNTFYVNRLRSERTDIDNDFKLYPWVESHASVDDKLKGMHLEILVDKQSVEVFANDGDIVFSNQVYFISGDTGISFYSIGGETTFENIRIEEIKI
ncbi:glycoside hydrolase family 32 protein [Dellaglioa sp. BT-FLS60]